MSAKHDGVVDSVWTRPGRGRRGDAPLLDRDQIVAGAVALLDAEGLGGLTMRALGVHLGVGTTSVYWYVRTKEDLFDLVMDEVLGEVALPPPDGARWRELAAALARDVRAMIIAHPWTTSLFGKSAHPGPKASRLSDASLGLFYAAGFDGGAAAFAATSLSALAVGYGISDAAWHSMLASSGLSPDELFASIDGDVDTVAGPLPNYRRWRAEAAPPDMARLREDAFEFGLQRQLAGLAALRDDPGPS